jgi:hypothetical protein
MLSHSLGAAVRIAKECMRNATRVRSSETLKRCVCAAKNGMGPTLHCSRQTVPGKSIAEARQILPDDRSRHLELTAMFRCGPSLSVQTFRASSRPATSWEVAVSPERNETSVLNEWSPALLGNAPKQKIRGEAPSTVRKPTAHLRPWPFIRSQVFNSRSGNSMMPLAVLQSGDVSRHGVNSACRGGRL